MPRCPQEFDSQQQHGCACESHFVKRCCLRYMVSKYSLVFSYARGEADDDRTIEQSILQREVSHRRVSRPMFASY